MKTGLKTYLMEMALALSGKEVSVSGQCHVPRVDDAEAEAVVGGSRQEMEAAGGRLDAGRAHAVDARDRDVEAGAGRLHHHDHSIQFFAAQFIMIYIQQLV